ncbi:MAG: aspartate aminotransferase family protein [Nitrososphaerales archaeon]
MVNNEGAENKGEAAELDRARDGVNSYYMINKNQFMLDHYVKLYESKTNKSRSLFDQSKKRFPGSVSHNIRFFEPYPFFTQKAHGKYLHDVDGNKYADYWMGHWSLILGHAPSVVVNALEQKVPEGTIVGTVNELSVRLADTISKVMPNAELMRFASTGSEATMNAVRLSRAYTGRRIVAKIVGGWHGFNSSLLKSINFPYDEEEGRGLLEEELKYVVSLPFNELDKTKKILNDVKDDLASIIVEPLLGGGGCVPAERDYLRYLQEVARRFNALFILDEIVTGFRLSLDGAQGLFSLDPDLFTLGKIAGGGMPIGIVCGKREVMELANPMGKKKGEKCSIGGGTFSANPLSMAAGIATLVHLIGKGKSVYEKIDKMGKVARHGIDKVMNENGVKVKSTGMGSLFLTHFLTDNTSEVRSAADVADCDVSLQKAYHFALMAKYGIFFLPNKMGAISVTHDEEDIEKLIVASEELAREIRGPR